MKALTEAEKNNLFQAFLELKTPEECEAFLEDLCSVAEIKSMIQRFEVAQMLDDERVYTDIVERTGASSATISRVSRALTNGKNGYRIALDRIKGKKGRGRDE